MEVNERKGEDWRVIGRGSSLGLAGGTVAERRRGILQG